MSHFTVLAILPPTPASQIEDALEKLLLPYKEFGWGSDEPDGFREKFCEFVDETKKILKEFKKDGYSLLRIASCFDKVEEAPTRNKFLDAWCKKNAPGSRGLSIALGVIIDEVKKEKRQEFGWSSQTCNDQEKLFKEKVKKLKLKTTTKVIFNKVFKTVDEFAEWYHNKKRTPDGKFGYYHNKNYKWDWYTVGGRWAGCHDQYKRDTVLLKDWLPVAGAKDALWESLDKHQRGEKVDGCEYDSWSLTSAMHNMGAWTAVADNKEKDGFKRTQKKLIRADLDGEYAWYFLPTTYAIVDNKGWYSAGEMGWWGCSSENADQNKEWHEKFMTIVMKDRDPDSVLVFVDCHI
jgi:hypothetical protein